MPRHRRIAWSQRQKRQLIAKGKKVNCFTNEEKEAKLDTTVPFLLESELRKLGAQFECSGKFEKHVAIDGNLITGQNPASAKGVAQGLLDYLKNGQPVVGKTA